MVHGRMMLPQNDPNCLAVSDYMGFLEVVEEVDAEDLG